MITIEKLREYVAKPEANYRWEKQSEQRSEHGTIVELEVLSQEWHGIPWKHMLRVFLPPYGTFPDTALLYIDGMDVATEGRIVGESLAAATGCVCAFLYSVPNQPLFGEMMEDDLIAHTFTLYLESEDPSWPLLFPMVKSAIRAMDALQAFIRREDLGNIQHFVLTGASKRGWTAWLTAAADPRVSGLMPQVFDNLNVLAQMPHQIESWGGYSEEISDYTQRDLPAKMNSVRGHALAEMIDPYSYRDSLTMPKLIINGANDRYWATDALSLYWDNLPAPKWVLYAPNSGHHLEDWPRVFNAMVAFLRAVSIGETLPTLSWNFSPLGEKHIYFALTSDTPAVEARLWGAHAPTRDFRSITWQAMPLRDVDIDGEGHRHFAGQITLPAAGYIGMFGEIEFQDDNRTYTLSTPIKLIGGK